MSGTRMSQNFGSMSSTVDKKLFGFRQVAQEKLQALLLTIPDHKKDLVIEPKLIRPLEHVCGASWLRSRGVGKIFKFQQSLPPPNNATLIYLISSDLPLFQQVLEQIQSYPINPVYTLQKRYHIIVNPKILSSFEYLMEEEGLHGLVGLHRFQWDFLFLDTGIVSLELQHIYRDIFIRNDKSMLSSIAHSLHLLQVIMSRPNIVMTYGQNSEAIFKMTQRIADNSRIIIPKHAPDFNAMLIVDRDKDYPSCLLTPVIYSGLMLELFDYNSGTLQVSTDNNRIADHKIKFLLLDTSFPRQEPTTTAVRMAQKADKIYEAQGYRHFSDVISDLTMQARALGVEGKTVKEMKLTEVQNYVANRLPKMAAQKKELSKHMLVCETIVKELGTSFEVMREVEESLLRNLNRKRCLQRVDELISMDAHKFNTVRLIALMHITWHLSLEEAQTFVRNYCNAFGYRYMTLFHELAKAKLFPDVAQHSKCHILAGMKLPKFHNQFQSDANKLKTIPAARDTANRTSPDCPSYVFNGLYIPLVAQLCSIILNATSSEELANKLSHFEMIKLKNRISALISVKGLMAAVQRGEVVEHFPMKPKTVFVYVVGGVTYAEVAACNLVEKLTGSKIVLASDTVFSGIDVISEYFNE